MKLPLILSLTGAASVIADFDIRRGDLSGSYKWFFTTSTFSIPDFGGHSYWDDLPAVFGPKQFRIYCDGIENGCGWEGWGPEKMNKLEIYLSREPLYHWTLSQHKNGRGWRMYGLDGKEYASCEIPSPLNGLEIQADDGTVVGIVDKRFTCKSPFTATQLNQVHE